MQPYARRDLGLGTYASLKTARQPNTSKYYGLFVLLGSIPPMPRLPILCRIECACSLANFYIKNLLLMPSS